ncbi:MAG: aldose 1-epimerase family protein [Candidatus Merdivicinus sp.]|jgi:galactose mutarotase-like enzyme
MIVTIQDKMGNSASIQTLGAELKSYRVNGTEYIWQGSPHFWSESAPFLFPIASNVRNDTVYIEGKPYHMPMHGFAKNLEWTLSEQQENCAVFILQETPETLQSYPFRFLLTATYSIQDGILNLTIKVCNQDNRQMPYCFGTHPAFCVPFDPKFGSKFTDYQIVFDKEEENSSPLYDGTARQIDIAKRESFLESDNRTLSLNYETFQRVDTILFDRMNSRRADLVDTVTGRKLTLEYPDFGYCAIWTTPGAPYVCIEPWQGLSTCSDEDDQFISKRGVKCLNPGEAEEYILRFSVTE